MTKNILIVDDSVRETEVATAVLLLYKKLGLNFDPGSVEGHLRHTCLIPSLIKRGEDTIFVDLCVEELNRKTLDRILECDFDTLYILTYSPKVTTFFTERYSDGFGDRVHLLLPNESDFHHLANAKFNVSFFEITCNLIPFAPADRRAKNFNQPDEDSTKEIFSDSLPVQKMELALSGSSSYYIDVIVGKLNALNFPILNAVVVRRDDFNRYGFNNIALRLGQFPGVKYIISYMEDDKSRFHYTVENDCADVLPILKAAGLNSPHFTHLQPPEKLFRPLD